MEEQAKGLDEDLIVFVMMGLGFGGFGLFSVARFVEPVRGWLVEHGVLASGATVLVPMGDGVGFDLMRCIVGGGILVLLIAGIVVVTRKRQARRRV